MLSYLFLSFSLLVFFCSSSGLKGLACPAMLDIDDLQDRSLVAECLKMGTVVKAASLETHS